MEWKDRHDRQKLQDPVKEGHDNHSGREHLPRNLPPGSTFDLVAIQAIGVADHAELIMPTSHGQEPAVLLSQHPAHRHQSNTKNDDHPSASTSERSPVTRQTDHSGPWQSQQSSTTNTPGHQHAHLHGPPVHPPPSVPPPMIPIIDHHPASSRRLSSDFLL